jgi:arylsulfatase A-like enzyme
MAIVWAAALLAVQTATAEPPASAPAKKRRSVLFYLVDTCRADHVSAHGYARKTTPFLEEFAKRGVRFDHCFSNAPWTKPSVGTILTSCYPTVTGMNSLLGQLDSSFVTLPEALHDAGWYTCGVSANPLMGRLSNYNQGFRRFTDATSVIQGGDCIHFASGSAKAVNVHALPWIEQNREWPFFLYLHSVDPHEEYAPAPEYLKLFADPAFEPEYRRQWKALLDTTDVKVANHCVKERFEKAKVAVEPFVEYGKQLYDADVRANDDEIGKVVAALEAKHLLDDMVVVVTADHGEEFMEHGGTSHAYLLWNELVHVPLIVVAPGLLPAGLVVKEPVQSLDLYPTLLELLGVAPPDSIQGKSFAPLCFGGEGDGRPIFAENHEVPGSEQFFLSQGTTLSLIDGPWKFILNVKSPSELPQPRRLLFRIDRDFGERHDLAEQEPERAAKYEERVLAWWARNQARHEGVAVKDLTVDELREADPATLEQLKKLGYVH